MAFNVSLSVGLSSTANIYIFSLHNFQMSQILLLHTSINFINILYIIHLHSIPSKSRSEPWSEHIGSLSVLSVSSDVMSCVLESAIIIICDCSPVTSLTMGLLGLSHNLTEVQLAKACLGLTGSWHFIVHLYPVCMNNFIRRYHCNIGCSFLSRCG